MTQYIQCKVSLKIKRLSSSKRLRMPFAKVNQKRYRSFLFVHIDKEHKKDILFIWALLRIAIDSHHNIIEVPELDIVEKPFSSRNNIAIL